MASLESLSSVGLGFSDFYHTQPGLTTALSGSNQPISYFGETPFIAQADSSPPLHLFIATTRQILVCSLTGKEEKVGCRHEFV